MKVLYLATVAITINSFFAPHIRALMNCGYSVDLACNVDAPLSQELIEMDCGVKNISFSRSPLSINNIKAYKQLKKVILDEQYDIVHCHTPNAAAITRLVCRRMRKNGLKVFYTAHGFHFYKGAPIKNWLLFYPVEWLCAHWTDTLITINAEDYALAKKQMHAKRVEYVPGIGIDLDKFKKFGVDQAKKRRELGIPADCTLLLSVGELNDNKNHKTVIKAIAGMNVYYAIAGRGPKKDEIEQLAAEANMSERVKLLGYRTDVGELYKAADVFILPSYREGLSVSLMEAMASGLPCIVSKIRGNVDLIEDDIGGYLCSPDDINGFADAITRLANNQCKQILMGQHNAEKAKNYSTESVLSEMVKIYEDASEASSVY